MALFSKQYSINLFQFASCCREWGSPTITNKLLARVIITLNRYKWTWNSVIIHWCETFRNNSIEIISTKSLTRALLTKPSRVPPERTVETIITAFSCPWNASAVPTVISSKPERRHACAILRRCILYGVTTPISDWDIFMKWEYAVDNNFWMNSITANTSLILNKL